MKSLICMVLGGAEAIASAQAPPPQPAAPTVAVQAVAERPSITGPAANFTGTAQISMPFQASPPGRAGGATVTFEAQARTAWHTHPLGQTLIVTAGLGLVQQEGQPAQVIRPGDIVTIPANVRHWHGAGPTGPMAHIAIAEKLDGNAVTWEDKVNDGQYQAALAGAGLALAVPATMPASDVDRRAKAGRGAPNAGAVPDTLSATQLAIPLIGAYMAISDLPRLDAALNQGLDSGMSVSEAKEVLVQLYAYTGFPKSLNALGQLLKVVEARQQRGVHDAAGRAPSRVAATGNALAAIGKANQTAISGGPVQGPVFDFAPVINEFLQSHLFGDVFERDNLDWQSRELATLGALAATPGVEAQLRSHVRASMRLGLSAAQLRQVAQSFSSHGIDDAASRINDAITQVVAPTPQG